MEKEKWEGEEIIEDIVFFSANIAGKMKKPKPNI